MAQNSKLAHIPAMDGDKKIGSAAQKLKALRTRLGFSMDEAATALGYAYASGYQRLETAKRPYLDLEKLHKIAPFLLAKGAAPQEIAELGGVPETALQDVTPPHLSLPKPEASALNWDDLMSAYVGFMQAKRLGYIPEAATDEEEAAQFRNHYERAIAARAKGR